MQLTKHRAQAGDTIIEVILAVSVFSLIAVSTLAIMNKGIQASTQALETTVVRQTMEGQAETLRYMHAAYIKERNTVGVYNLGDTATSPGEEYSRIITLAKAKTSGASALSGYTSCPAVPEQSFMVDPVNIAMKSGATYLQRATVYPELTYSGSTMSSRGIWIEPVRRAPSTTAVGFIDFHIRACWNTMGSPVPTTLGTIVRLYEPRN